MSNTVDVAAWIRTRRIEVYSVRANAESASGRGRWVVMGDAGSWWVVRPVDAARLEAAGYEIAC